MYLTYLILAVTIAISLLAFERPELLRRFILNPYEIVHYKKWYRSISHGFIHADFMHLFFNMYVLYMFGIQGESSASSAHGFGSVEPILLNDFGSKGYLYFFLLYVGGILFSSLFAIFKNQDNPNYNALGASGAVSAIVFVFIILNPNAELGIIFIPGIYLPAYIFGPLMLVGEYYLAKRGRTRIAHDAHISGAIYGLVILAIIDIDYYINFINAIFN